jgi:hypothetical protein
MAAVAVLLSVFSNGYGFHRDELYFRMLRPSWGYVDQGPLTPLLVRFFAHHVADQPWGIHIPSTVFTVVSVLVVVLITRELGGGRGAQVLCAWSYAFSTAPLVFGHVMLTSSLDLVVWPLTTIFIVRALLRDRPQWWLAAGVVVGLSMYNKLLIAMLLAAFAVALALVGPRSVFRSGWVVGSGVLALLIGAPNIAYQVTHHWPEITMGRALAANNASDVRVLVWPFLIILYGPPLAVMWATGFVALWRRRPWRPVRFLAVALPVLLLFVVIAGTQFYYPSGLLAVLIAVGCIPASEFVARHGVWRIVLVVSLVINAMVSAVLALPVVPVSDVGSTPVPAINQTARDSIGWPSYVGQIASVYDALPPAAARHAVVIASNYGEAGAVARYGPADGIPTVYSAHNQLYYQSRPPSGTRVAVVVGGEMPTFRRQFTRCVVEARLHDGVGVVNEEQGEPIALCRGPRAPWPAIWPRLQHYD